MTHNLPSPTPSVQSAVEEADADPDEAAVAAVEADLPKIIKIKTQLRPDGQPLAMLMGLHPQPVLITILMGEGRTIVLIHSPAAGPMFLLIQDQSQ